MHEAWLKYGKLEWRELVEPAIVLAREGFVIHKALDKAIKESEKNIRKLKGLRLVHNLDYVGYMKQNRRGQRCAKKIIVNNDNDDDKASYMEGR